VSTPRATELALESADGASAAPPARDGGALAGIAHGWSIARWADVLVPLAIVAVALPMRLANIGSYSGKGDEGIRAEQLLLMAAGFRPVKEVFASQGPLSLDVFYPFYLALGQTLAGARLATVVASILAIVAVYWTARQAGGRIGGWLAAALLIASPTFLKNSRLALVEIPAILPAIVALGAALAYQRRGERRWLIASAVALALALAIKPMVVAVVPAVGLALLLRPHPSNPPLQCEEGGDRPMLRLRLRESRGGSQLIRDLMLYAAVAGVLLAAIVAWAGPAELYDQLVRYRVGSREAEGWSLRDNWEMLWGELQWDQPAFFALAALGGVVLLVARPRAGVPLLTWGLLSFGLLLVYSPLGIKHAALQIPPTSLLAGAGLGALWEVLTGRPARASSRPDRVSQPSPHPAPRGRGSTSLRWGLAGLAGLGVAAYLLAVSTLAARDQQAMTVGDLGADPPYRQESQLIQALTGPADFILVDDPYLAFLNGRMMPPWLVDTSYFRIRSGALTGADVVAHAEAYDVRLMLLASDNLRDLKKFRDWADEQFVVAKIDERSNRKDRALYLPAAADLDAARSAVRAAVPNVVEVDGQLADQVRVRSYALEQDSARAGGSVGLTIEWEAVGPIALDWRQVTVLRDRSGQIVDQTERSLSGGSSGTSTWAPGRWVFRSSGVPIPARTPPGEYTLGVGLYDSKARRMATVTAGPDLGGDELRLGMVRVR
jgi:hypothetical protein